MIDTPAAVVQDHLKQYAALKIQKDKWIPWWQDVTDFVAPQHVNWTDDDNDDTPASPASTRYDGTAVEDLQNLVDGFMGNMVSEAFPWIRTVTEDPELGRGPGVADHLEAVDELLLSTFRRWGLYGEMSSYIRDLASLGTACMLVDDDLRSRGIIYSTRHLKEYYIAEDRTHKVDVLYRRFNMTNRQALQAWPGTVDQRRKDAAKEDPHGKHPYIHAVFPSNDDGFLTVEEPRMAWSSCYIDVGLLTHLEQAGYEDFPYVVGRWRQDTGQTYGTSPAIDALQDVLRVNNIAKTILQAGHRATDPPLNIPADQKGDTAMDLGPGGRYYYSSPEKVVKPIDTGHGYQIGRDVLEQVREQIHGFFRRKVFALLQELEAAKVQSATWVNKVSGEQAVLLGPIVGRFASETIQPLTRRTYKILTRRGETPVAPPALVLSKGARVKLELQGPLAQVQRRHHQSQGVLAGTEFTKAVMTLNPDAADNVDFDELARIGMDVTGMPQRVIREAPAVAQLRKVRMQAAAKQAQAAQAAATEETVAKNADKLNEPVKPGSMLAAAAGGRR